MQGEKRGCGSGLQKPLQRVKGVCTRMCEQAKMTYEELKKVFGSNVKKYRRKAGIKQYQFAIELDVWTQTVQLIERGARFPRPDLFLRICEALNVEPYLLFISDNEISEGFERFLENEK